MITDIDIAEARQRLQTLRDALHFAHLVAWDECHKIYLALDKVEADSFRESGYITFEGTPDEMFDKVHGWYDASCPLVFINAVRHDSEQTPHHIWGTQSVFTDIVPQCTELVMWVDS